MALDESSGTNAIPHCPSGGVLTPPPTCPETVSQGACEIGPVSQQEHAENARQIRLEQVDCPYVDARCGTEAANCFCDHPCNGDERFYHESPTLPNGDPNPYSGQYPASYSKGLPHAPLTGLVAPAAYQRLLTALATQQPADFEAVPLGCTLLPPPTSPPKPCQPMPGRLLENPQSGLAFQLEGADPRALVLPSAPCFASPREAAEIGELYWMALTRDVPFIRYECDARIADAVCDINKHFAQNLSTHTKGPFTPCNLFRGPTQGDRKGPHLSQFLLLDVPYGSQFISAMIRTLRGGVDFLTNWNDWLCAQDGCDADQSNCDEQLRLIRNGRDLAQFVHVDRDFNAFLNACQLLLFGREPLRRCEARPGLGVPFGPCLPYRNPMAPPREEFPTSSDPEQGKSTNQLGQGTFGDQYFKSVLVGATARAFDAVWYQKWFVHRRLRPEEFGGRVHLRRLKDTGKKNDQRYAFPIDQSLFNSKLFTENRVFNYNARQNANRRTPPADLLGQPSHAGTYLLPMVYAEGSPLHPSYGSGHSTVSGCLATLLKAFFHNDWAFPNPVEPNEDGTSLRPYVGGDMLTVAGELDKLASNIGIGRLWAGVHWRSDHEESLLLGEQVAISILCDQRNTFNEFFEFRFRSFDFGPYGGQVVRIRPGGSDCSEPCVELIGEYEGPCDRRRSLHVPNPCPNPCSEEASTPPA